jgi:hypothetical protein
MMKRVTMAICMFAALCVMSTSALGAQKFKNYEVGFKALPNKGELRADTDGQNCDRGQGNDQKKMGCVRFEEDDFGLITFHTKPQVKTCADPGTNWVISKVELTSKGYELSGGVLSNKGIFKDYLPLVDWLAAAFPQVDQATGVLYEADPPKTGLTRVTRLNLNNNATADPKDIWYRVSVASCKKDSDVVLVSDPRFENEGKH